MSGNSVMTRWCTFNAIRQSDHLAKVRVVTVYKRRAIAAPRRI
jgi:hypothetical protein